MAAERVEDGLGVLGGTGNLDEECVVALLLDSRRGGTGGVDAIGDDELRLLHLLGGNGRAIGRGGLEIHRNATLDVKTLGDLVLRWIQCNRRGDGENDDEHEACEAFAVALCL